MSNKPGQMTHEQTLFISDLHLSQERPQKLALFHDFLTAARGCDGLYILGDLFEVWLGDDDDTPPNTEVLAALRDFSDSGTPLWVMRGNRDLLLNNGFSTTTGAQLLPDPSCIELYGESTLLMHGDLLCTRDMDYLAFRAMAHEPHFQSSFLARPLADRRTIAAGFREYSVTAMQDKPEEIMDVEADAVAARMQQAGVRSLIHGHTHKPGRHEFELDGQAARRTVLGDWYTQESVLVCRPDGQALLPVADFLRQAD